MSEQGELIRFKNTGAVQLVEFRAPLEGGLIVLQGPNGVGKTTLLDAADALLAGKGTVPVSDGADKAEVSGWGAQIRVGSRTTHNGELEIVSLEGRLKLDVFVDPGLKDKVAADMERVRQLVQICGKEARVEDYYELVGGQNTFDTLCPSAAQEADGDALKLRSIIKRRLENEALKHEAAAEQQERNVDAIRKQIADIDFSLRCDEKELADEHEAAVMKHAGLKGLIQQADATTAAGQEARSRLDAILAEPALSVAEAESRRDAIWQAVTDNKAALVEAEAELRKAEEHLQAVKAALSESKAKHDAADQAVIAANQRKELIATCESALRAAEGVKRPTAEELQAAADAVTAAGAAVQKGAFIRDAKAKVIKKEEHRELKARHVQRAEELRQAALGTDGILSGYVQTLGTGLRFEQGRLVLDTDRKKGEYFAELSKGERWKLTIRLAARVIGVRGAFVIPQEAFEGLDEDVRQEIVAELHNQHVTAITAECTVAHGPGIHVEQL